MMESQNGHPYIKHHSCSLKGVSILEIPVASDKDVNSVDTHIHVAFGTGSAVAAVHIWLVILHEIRVKTDDDFPDLQFVTA